MVADMASMGGMGGSGGSKGKKTWAAGTGYGGHTGGLTAKDKQAISVSWSAAPRLTAWLLPGQGAHHSSTLSSRPLLTLCACMCGRHVQETHALVLPRSGTAADTGNALN